LTEKEEALILATLDPLSAMAATDEDLLAGLVSTLDVNDGAVQALLDELAASGSMDYITPASGSTLATVGTSARPCWGTCRAKCHPYFCGSEVVHIRTLLRVAS
jgi:hypothetical protein